LQKERHAATPKTGIKALAPLLDQCEHLPVLDRSLPEQEKAPLRQTLIVLAFGLISTSLSAAPARQATVSDDVIRSLTRCSVPVKISRQPLGWRLPQGTQAEVVLVQSDSAFCATQLAAITLPSGRFFLGGPWPLTDIPGGREEKLKTFAWTRMKETVTPKIDPSQAVDGFQKVRLTHKTPYGDLVTEGWIDQAGLIFLPGDLHQPGENIVKSRAAKAQKATANMPSSGPLTAAVTVYEFSDFQCPSCKHANAFMKQVIGKYGDKIRYVRVDFPIMSHHPWAFGASAAAQAIYRQSPDVFRKFKDAVYESQDSLTTFTLDDFAAGFVKDHGLDFARYEKDVVSPAIRSQVLAGIALAHAVDVNATPTFMVNGVFIDPGHNGAAIDAYIAQRLAGK
jgi:protein-disulfide isomerase